MEGARVEPSLFDKGVEPPPAAVSYEAGVRVRTGETRQMRVVSAGDGYASQFSKTLHFGLGEHQVVDEL